MGKKKSKKMDIVIHVDPVMAAVAMGLLSGFLESIMDHMQTSLEGSGVTLNGKSLHDGVRGVLDEVYEKCIAQTNIRERVSNMIDLYEMTGDLMPSEEEN